MRRDNVIRTDYLIRAILGIGENKRSGRNGLEKIFPKISSC